MKIIDFIFNFYIKKINLRHKYEELSEYWSTGQTTGETIQQIENWGEN